MKVELMVERWVFEKVDQMVGMMVELMAE